MGPFNYSHRNIVSDKPYSAYASVVLTISGAASDYSVQDNSTLFSKLTVAHELLIKDGDSDFTIKFNQASNDSIPIVKAGQISIEGYSITDIFITASGNLTVNLVTLGWK
jgi:hypothetical protein